MEVSRLLHLWVGGDRGLHEERAWKPAVRLFVFLLPVL